MKTIAISTNDEHTENKLLWSDKVYGRMMMMVNTYVAALNLRIGWHTPAPLEGGIASRGVERGRVGDAEECG